MTGDSDIETGVTEVVFALGDTGYQEQFKSLDFGEGLKGVVIVLMCRDPGHNFRQRIRMSRVEKTLYMDVMLPYEAMISGTEDERKSIVAALLYQDLRRVLEKYKLKDLDAARLLTEIADALLKAGWVKDRRVFDH